MSDDRQNGSRGKRPLQRSTGNRSGNKINEKKPGQKAARTGSPGKTGSTAGSRNSSAHRRKALRRSRYYRRRRQKMILLGSTILLILFLILVLSLIFRACKGSGSSAKDEKSASGSIASDENTDRNVNNDSSDGDVTEITPTPAIIEPVTLTVSVVGDCTLGTDENFDYDTSLNAYFYSYGADYFLENVRSIFQSDDLTIANFEGTLTDSENREDKQFAFKAPAEFAKILSGSSVETVNTANNHSHDYGEDSFTDTMRALDAEGIVHFGYDETAVVDVKGVKIGLVGIYELYDHLERTEQLKTNIAKVKEDGADLVIVIFHWGNEKEDVPDDNQMTLGRLAIDEGADLVCGHHPHVLQGMETYKGRNIVYSLGNFCFGGNSYPSDTDTIIFQQTFTIDQDGVRTDNVTNIIPCSITSDYGYNNYQPTPSEGDEAARIMQKFEERSSWIPAADQSGSQ